MSKLILTKIHLQIGTKWFINLLAEICNFNTQKYKKLFCHFCYFTYFYFSKQPSQLIIVKYKRQLLGLEII